MSAKIFLLRFCRMLLPGPKPTLALLNSIFSSSRDARHFIVQLLYLPSFDRINRWITHRFTDRAAHAGPVPSTLSQYSNQGSYANTLQDLHITLTQTLSCTQNKNIDKLIAALQELSGLLENHDESLALLDSLSKPARNKTH
jgi:hypothetical protein